MGNSKTKMENSEMDGNTNDTTTIGRQNSDGELIWELSENEFRKYGDKSLCEKARLTIPVESYHFFGYNIDDKDTPVFSLRYNEERWDERVFRGDSKYIQLILHKKSKGGKRLCEDLRSIDEDDYPNTALSFIKKAP